MKNRNKLKIALILSIIALHAFSSQLVLAAGIPYLENFDSYDNTANPGVMPAGFTLTAGWSLQDDGAGNDLEYAALHTYTNPTGTATEYRPTVVQITNAAGMDFVMSAEMTIDAAVTTHSSNNVEVGLTCFSSGVFTPGYKGAIDLANFEIGTISLQKNYTKRASTLFPANIIAGRKYTLTIRGTYNANSSLTLVFTVTDGISTASVSYTDLTPLVGQLFGFENVLFMYPGGTSAAIDVHYDELSILPAPPLNVTLQSPRIEGNEFKFQFAAQTGRVYRVESREHLTSGDWTPVGNNILATSSSVEVFDSIGVSTQRFYQVVLLP